MQDAFQRLNLQLLLEIKSRSDPRGLSLRTESWGIFREKLHEVVGTWLI